ncbi:AcrR family transcriptional regulator [Paenibacillus sp. SORGH_AS306]|uniref:TetR/AcrR family transcriptional regulator n=1 Tax=unclassified Paenibacillus TaxID=185978 RepID=UPI00277EE637|nr:MULTISPECIES: TetR/AcrR family transcriptional regulator [unclassified Paenibacillus]MDQ1236464.1 AcrR family transcriptional regulator [Paenibacillus sp. SORGH_AS_0306]MDR6108818.1 AcrR family transcriptional regulator [Paenibacillus sp. SORGH_AS_0338]
MVNVNDLRVVRTQSWLREALIKLIDQVGFDAVTVQSLTREAGINRATFYQHYRDKYDLLEKSMTDMLTSLQAEVKVSDMKKVQLDIHSLEALFLRVLTIISRHQIYFKVMLGDKGLPSFQSQLTGLIKANLYEVIGQHFSSNPQQQIMQDIAITYVATANVGLLTQWLTGIMPYSAEFMATQMAYLFVEGPLQTLQQTST